MDSTRESGMTTRNSQLRPTEKSAGSDSTGGSTPPESTILFTTKVRISLKGMFDKGNLFNNMKSCVSCGRYTPWLVYYNYHKWGWRVCPRHMSQETRDFIRANYKDGSRIIVDEFLARQADT